MSEGNVSEQEVREDQQTGGERAGGPAGHVLVFDTTLRDGEQSPGISLSVRDKLEIAEQLARMGVDVVEAGFPVTSQGDFEAVRAIAQQVRDIRVCALSRAVEGDIDRAWEAIREAEAPRIHTFIATSDIHIRHKLGKTRDEVVEMARHAVEYARKYCPDVEFSPEDATRSDMEYLVRVVRAAIDAGATTINIPDTVGYALPEEFAAMIDALREAIPEFDSGEVVMSVHCHNDLGLAVANSLAAVMHGARQVECTVNGLGERAGNAAMEEVVMALAVRERDVGVKTRVRTQEIWRASQLVSNLTNYPIQFNKAIVGANAFAHSSGIHTDGMLKDRTTYEIMRPEDIGLAESKLVLGKTSGRAAFRAKLAELGHELPDEEFQAAFERFKDLADKKAEITDADIVALLSDEARLAESMWRLTEFEGHAEPGKRPWARVVICREEECIEARAEGDGQVDASCTALRQALGIDAHLVTFAVKAITGGLDAQGDVTIQIEVDGETYIGRGVDTDIVAASAKAYLNALNKVVMARERKMDVEGTV
ncbi:MAG: 2-isopropylmalate synthase [Coriobacteriia bacterium]